MLVWGVVMIKFENWARRMMGLRLTKWLVFSLVKFCFFGSYFTVVEASMTRYTQDYEKLPNIQLGDRRLHHYWVRPVPVGCLQYQRVA